LRAFEFLAEYAIDALTEESPSYFQEHEKAFTKEVLNFSAGLVQECKNGSLLKLSDEAIEEIIENKIGDTLNASCVLNQEYFIMWRSE